MLYSEPLQVRPVSKPCIEKDPPLIASQLRAFREHLGLSQREMAKRYKVSVRTLKRWEGEVIIARGPNLYEDRQLLADFFAWYFFCAPADVSHTLVSKGIIRKTNS